MFFLQIFVLFAQQIHEVVRLFRKKEITKFQYENDRHSVCNLSGCSSRSQLMEWKKKLMSLNHSLVVKRKVFDLCLTSLPSG